MKKSGGMLLFITLAMLSGYCVSSLYHLHSAAQRGQSLSRLADLPEPLAQTMTLEFPGLASDFLMLKVLTYLGEKILNKDQLTNDEWQIVYRTLKQITNLDPRFLDPYVVAQMTLPFDAGMVKETNVLLEKASQILVDDYRPNFFLWYNHFYFLNDPATAGIYLEKAARIPGAPGYFSTLAARMNLYAGKIKAAVIFLEQNLRETTDPAMRQFISLRIESLKKIGFLEAKILEYRKRYDKFPDSLQDLIDSGLVARIPKDPYGGKFYIMEGGRVYSTSKLVLPKKQQN